jgi:hypothetical protein
LSTFWLDIQEGIGFENSVSKGLEGLHVLLNLLNWELDKHTSDLWSLGLTDQHFNEFVDQVTNLVLVEWVSLLDGVDKTGSSLSILLLWGHWLLLLLRWLLLLLLLLWWDLLLHLWHVVLLHLLWHALWHVWLLTHLLWHIWVWSSHHVVSVLAHVLSWSTWSESSLLLTLSTSLLHLVWLNELEELLNDVSQVWLVGQLHQVEVSTLLGNVLVPVSSISNLFELEISDFLDFVVVDDETLTVEVLVLEGLLGLGALIWLLEANESIDVLVCSFFELDSLNFTVLAKEVFNFFFGPVLWEVLYIEVASLL